MNGLQLVSINAGIAIFAVATQFGVRALVAWFTTKDYFAKYAQQAQNDGFVERQFQVREGTTINYAQKPGQKGIPLLLIPGQGCIWQEYCKTLPLLTDTFNIIVVDVHGHGASSWNPEDYTADQIATDLSALVQEVFAEPAIVAGHSSGGLIAAKMAARYPEQVRGVLFEDAPFFATEPDRVAHTYVGIDNYANVETFLAQRDSDHPLETDWVCWYMPRSYWRRLFGGPLWSMFTRKVIAQRRANPAALPIIRWLSININRIWETVSHPYDLRFTKAFIDNTWFRDFEQAETLAAIKCPTAFLKATTRFDKQGNLLAALDDNDLARVESLLSDNQTTKIRSSHDIHFAHPKVYARVLKQLAART